MGQNQVFQIECYICQFILIVGELVFLLGGCLLKGLFSSAPRKKVENKRQFKQIICRALSN
jgi:hypothetical protein